MRSFVAGLLAWGALALPPGAFANPLPVLEGFLVGPTQDCCCEYELWQYGGTISPTQYYGTVTTPGVTISSADGGNPPPVISDGGTNVTFSVPPGSNLLDVIICFSNLPANGAAINFSDNGGAINIVSDNIVTNANCPIASCLQINYQNITNNCADNGGALVSFTLPTPVNTCNCTLQPTPTVHVSWTSTMGTASFDEMPGTLVQEKFPIGVTPVTLTATNECGESASCTFSITVVGNVSPPAGVWAFADGGGNGSIQGTAMAVDGDGNIFVGGKFTGTATFTGQLPMLAGVNAFTFNTQGNSTDGFLAKYDTAGHLLWAQQVGSSNSVSGVRSVAVDSQGNCFATGSFEGSAFPDYLPITPNYVVTYLPNACIYGALYALGSQDMFLAKYDPQGNVLWAVNAGDNVHNAGSTDGQGVAVDSAGNCYVTGGYQNDVDFYDIFSPCNEPTPGLSGLGGRDAYLAKFDSFGNFVWATGSIWSTANPPSATATSRSVAVESVGGTLCAWIVGTFQSGTNSQTVRFGSPSSGVLSSGPVNSQYSKVFVVQYANLDAASPTAVWAKQTVSVIQSAGCPTCDQHYGLHDSRAIGVDEYGNSYFTAYFNGSATIGTLAPVSDQNPWTGDYGFAPAQLYDYMVGSFDKDGNARWLINGGQLNDNESRGLAVNYLGNVFVTGEYGANGQFYSGGTNVMLNEYDMNGNLLLSETGVAHYPDAVEITAGFGVAVDAAGCFYATGTFDDPGFPSDAGLIFPEFAPVALAAPGGLYDLGSMFVLKYCPTCNSADPFPPPPISGYFSYGVAISSGLTSIANQLTLGNNTLNEIMPVVPDGSAVYKYVNSSSNWVISTYSAAAGQWLNGNSISLNPGDAAFFQSPTNFTLTFTGTPHVPVLPVTIPSGACYLLSRQTNDVGTFENIVGTQPSVGAAEYQWNPGTESYNIASFVQSKGGVSNWAPSELTAQVGSALWLSPSGGGAPVLPPTNGFEILSPTNGAFCAGSTETITWSGGLPSWNVEIQLIDYTHWIVYSTIVASTPNTGSYVWTIPPTVPTGVYEIYIQQVSAIAWTYGGTFTINGTLPVMNCPSNKVVQCGSTWTFDQPTATSCCTNPIILSNGLATNILITSTGIVTNGVCPQVLITESWTAVDGCGDTNTCSQTVTVLGCCPPNCCAGCAPPYTNSYTVTVYPGTNYVADDLCQGTNNILADVLPNPPGGTEAIFWDQATQSYNIFDQFQFGAWQNGTEPLSPGEGFVLINPTSSNFTFTISGCPSTCPPPCAPTNGFWLVGGMGTNTSTYSNLFSCPPVCGTQVMIWNPLTQQFTTDTYVSGVWTPSVPVLAPGQAAWVDISSTTGLFVNCPTNKTVPCASTWAFDQPTATSCCGNISGTTTNVSITSTGIVTNGVCPQVTITETWLITDACGESNICSQTVLVLGCCTNCCAGCVAPYPDSYTVTLYPGTNYVADNLCQGSNNTLAAVVPSVPNFTVAYFWNEASQTYNAVDQFHLGAWQNGTEPLSPGEGFILINTSGSNYTLTISGCVPTCPPPCAPTNGFWLVGGFGTNDATYSNLFSCPPVCGTEVMIFNPVTQQFATDTYVNGVWVPSAPVLAPGQAAWVNISTNSGIAINCPPGKTVPCGTPWKFDRPTASSCCTNLIVTSTGLASSVLITSLGIVTNGTNPEYITQTWSIIDGCGDSNICSQTVTLEFCCVPSPANMVLWLPFDETVGPIAANLEAPADYGTWINNPTPVSGAYVDNSLGFHFTNYVSVPSYAAINPSATQSFTLDAWVNRGANGPNTPACIVLDKRNPANGNGYSLSVDYGHVFLTLDGVNYSDATDVVPADNNWHFIAVTVIPGTPKGAGEFYVDGHTPMPFAPLPANLATANAFLVGISQTDPGLNQGWSGGIDEVEMYNRALSSNEVWSIYNAHAAGKCKCVPAPANIALWLPFDETNGPIAANLVSVPNFGTWINNPVPILGSYVDNSLSFNGSQYVVVPSYPVINPSPTQSFTLDAWVNRGTNGPNSPPCVVMDERDNPSGNGFSLSVDYGHVILTLSGNNYSDATDLVPTDNQWHFIAVAANPRTGVGNFYVDGHPPVSFSPALPGAMASPTTPFYVGISAVGGNQPWIGGIDEVEMFDRALSSNEIYGIYNAGKLGKCKEPCFTVTCPLNKSVPCGAAWSFDLPTAVSCCSSNVVIRSLGIVTNGTNPEYITQTWSVSDACGNSNICSQTVTVPFCCVTPPANMVLWLPFDELIGPFAANLEAPLDYGTWINNPVPVVGSYVDNSLSFNGVQYVSVPNYAAINPGTSQSFTLDAWVNRPATGPNSPPCVILDKRDPSTGNGYSLSVDYGNVFLTLSGNNYFETAYKILPGSGWHFIAVTVSLGSPTSGEFYIDGNPPVPFTPAPVTLTTTNAFLVGYSLTDPGDNEGWHGDIDEVEMYNRALSSNEIAGIYGARVAGKCKTNCYTGIVYTCPTNKSVQCGSVWSFNPPTATTCCGNGVVTIRPLGTVTNGICPKIITETWALTDDCGHLDYCSQSVTNVDTTAPVITDCPTLPLIEKENANCQFVIPLIRLLATDNCTPTNQLVWSQSPAAGTLESGTTVVIVTVTDLCGNSSQCSVVVEGQPTTPPVVTCPSNMIVTNCLVPAVPVSVTDRCCPYPPVITQTPPPGSSLCPGVNYVTITVTDCHLTTTKRVYLSVSGPESFLSSLYNTGASTPSSSATPILLADGVKDTPYSVPAMTTSGLCASMPSDYYPALAPVVVSKACYSYSPCAWEPYLGCYEYVPWDLTTTASKWIGPNFTNNGCDPCGLFTYSMQFTLPAGINPSTATISGRFAADDAVAGVTLNSHALPFPSGSFSYWTPFVIAPNTYFTAGLNTLAFTVTNAEIWTGLRVEFTNAFGNCCVCSPPVSQPPVGISLPLGSTATFTVAPGGTPPFTYQWYKGVALVNSAHYTGVTTPSLRVHSIGFADAGLYSVVIANPCGVVTDYFQLRVTLPPPWSNAWWNVAVITNPLAATIGPDLILGGTNFVSSNYSITAGTTEDFGLPEEGGQIVNVMHILPDANPLIEIPPVAAPGSNSDKSYTLMMDIYEPDTSLGTPSTLFQSIACCVSNLSSGGQDGLALTLDASNNLHLGGSAAGVPFDSGLPANFPVDTWNRVAFVVDDPQDGVAVTVSLYLNGQSVASFAVPTPVGLPVNWSSSPPTLLSRQTNDLTLNGDFYVSSIQFSDTALSPEGVAGLGSPDEGPSPTFNTPTGTTLNPALSATLSNGVVNITWSGSPYVLLETTSLSSGVWVNSMLDFTETEVNGNIVNTAVANPATQGPAKFYMLINDPGNTTDGAAQGQSTE